MLEIVLAIIIILTTAVTITVILDYYHRRMKQNSELLQMLNANPTPDDIQEFLDKNPQHPLNEDLRMLMHAKIYREGIEVIIDHLDELDWPETEDVGPEA